MNVRIECVLVMDPSMRVYVLNEDMTHMLGFMSVKDYNAKFGTNAHYKIKHKINHLCFDDGWQSQGVIVQLDAIGRPELRLSGPALMDLVRIHAEQCGAGSFTDGDLRLYFDKNYISYASAFNFLFRVVPRIADVEYDGKHDDRRGSVTGTSVALELRDRPEFWKAAIAPDATVTVKRKGRC